MDIKHIILAGESAGGHLAIAVAFLASLRGFRQADGIMSNYPNLSKDANRFFPSTLMTLDDVITSQSIRKMFSACFMKNGGNPEVNPILTITNAPLSLLRMLPQLRVTACEADSLRD